MKKKDFEDILDLTNDKEKTPNKRPAKTNNNKSLRCDNCGSVDIDLVFEDLGKCMHCGAKIPITKQITNVTNKYVIVNKEPDEKSNDEILCYTTDKVYRSIDEFKREALLNLTYTTTPVEVFDCDFSNCKIEYKQYALVEVDIDLSYTATIGYDREEQYVDKENRYSNGRSYQVDVIKTRTVTDWHPTSGTAKGVERVLVEINAQVNNIDYEYDIQRKQEDYYGKYHDEIVKENKFIEFSQSKIKDKIEIEYPTKNDYDRASEKGAFYTMLGVSLGGDHVKNKNYTFKSKVINTKIFVIPQYVLRYNYDGNEHKATSYVGDKRIYGCEDYFLDTAIDEATTRKSSWFNSLTLISIVMSIIISAIWLWTDKRFSASFAKLTITLFIISTILFALSFALQALNKRNIKAQRQREKRQKVEEIFKKLGLKSLTEEEINKIEKRR